MSAPVPPPRNEPVHTYAPGSPERRSLRAALADIAASPRPLPMVVGGREVEARGEAFTVRAPHDHGLVLGEGRRATEADVGLAIEVALAAREEWAATPWEARAAVLLRAADLLQSLRLLQAARRMEPRSRTKSGLMLGLGESLDEVRELLTMMRAHDVEIVTIGQYLRPSLKHHPLIRFVPPEEFASLREFGVRLGFEHVESGPLVRSSYHAADQVGPAHAEAG